MLQRFQPVEIALDVDGEPPPNHDVLRIAQEALQNAIRHADARHITIRLANGRLEVEDDGVGFDPSDPAVRSRRLGLTSMEERARRLGGRLEIHSVKGAGTTVALELE